MTVAELIKVLQAMPQDIPILLDNDGRLSVLTNADLSLCQPWNGVEPWQPQYVAQVLFKTHVIIG